MAGGGRLSRRAVHRDGLGSMMMVTVMTHSVRRRRGRSMRRRVPTDEAKAQGEGSAENGHGITTRL
jgi:hypothetical protein